MHEEPQIGTQHAMDLARSNEPDNVRRDESDGLVFSVRHANICKHLRLGEERDKTPPREHHIHQLIPSPAVAEI